MLRSLIPSYCSPRVERLHAEVLLLTGQINRPQAIARIEAAAAHARQQGALALEWRATMALARLYVERRTRR